MVLEPAMGVGNFFGKMPMKCVKILSFMALKSTIYQAELQSRFIPMLIFQFRDLRKITFQNGCFDVAFGNVPFGDLSFTDNVHSTTKLHDYFFAETLDKVKNGGILAFVTSSGTLDKQNESTRKMLAEKSDFIGAIRLPNTAFKKKCQYGSHYGYNFFCKKNENKKFR